MMTPKGWGAGSPERKNRLYALCPEYVGSTVNFTCIAGGLSKSKTNTRICVCKNSNNSRKQMGLEQKASLP